MLSFDRLSFPFNLSQRVFTCLPCLLGLVPWSPPLYFSGCLQVLLEISMMPVVFIVYALRLCLSVENLLIQCSSSTVPASKDLSWETSSKKTYLRLARWKRRNGIGFTCVKRLCGAQAWETSSLTRVQKIRLWMWAPSSCFLASLQAVGPEFQAKQHRRVPSLLSLLPRMEVTNLFIYPRLQLPYHSPLVSFFLQLLCPFVPVKILVGELSNDI